MKRVHDPEPTPRASAIAEGLLRTGRASNKGLIPGFIRLDAKEGGHYWVRFDGLQLLRGLAFNMSAPLQRGFANAMARAGAHAR